MSTNGPDFRGKSFVFSGVTREISLLSKISRRFLQCAHLWAVLVETDKSDSSCFYWRCSMFEISRDASSVKDTFTVKGSNTCTAETYWISSTIHFEISSSSQTWYWSTKISINDTSYISGVSKLLGCAKTSKQIWITIFIKIVDDFGKQRMLVHFDVFDRLSRDLQFAFTI